jgi:uncharacterized protein (TIGR03000 family)
MGAYGYQPEVLPGFGATLTVRSRATLYPAISEPSAEVIRAALEDSKQDRAYILVHVPTVDAQVYFDGVLTRQTGLDRKFVTPPLGSGARYGFQVEVAWRDEAGRARRVTRHVSVRAGETADVDP